IITELDGTPAPHRPGGPPIVIGGGGRRVLRFAGATADIVGVNASVHSGEVDVAAAQDALPERIDEKLGWVREGAGERFDDLELNAWLAVAEVTDAADEPATGDGMRMAGKPFFGCQRGKRDIAVNIKAPEGRELALELVRRADAVHHNMTKGTATKLGIDYEACKTVKPDIVYCNTYAYG